MNRHFLQRTTWVNIIVFLLIFLCGYAAHGEPIRDDFTDGSIADSDPIAWVPVRSTISFAADGLQLSNPNGIAAIVQTEDANSTGWSIRVRARQEFGDITGAGTRSSAVSWAYLTPQGLLRVGQGESVLAEVSTGIDPSVDFILQLDTFDNELRAWAWPAGSDPASTAPLVTSDYDTLSDASAAFWVRDFAGGGLAQSTFEWFEFSDQHIPIPVPEPDGVPLLVFGIVLAARGFGAGRGRRCQRAKTTTT